MQLNKFIILNIILSSILVSKPIEKWISTTDIKKIYINMALESVESVLGEPLFIESANDDDIIITKYIYSFRTKEYEQNLLNPDIQKNDSTAYTWGRNTNVQFVFHDNILVLWEEEKLTLSQAANLSNSGGSIFAVINVLLHIVSITLCSAVLMAL
tara:strand:- start:43 stop:510 length:468 start_codon:yes stop_codon:yes gene_type:complete